MKIYLSRISIVYYDMYIFLNSNSAQSVLVIESCFVPPIFCVSHNSSRLDTSTTDHKVLFCTLVLVIGTSQINSIIVLTVMFNQTWEDTRQYRGSWSCWLQCK